ncbi:hypothetical protein ABZ641_34650, partial [Kitasatospora sp. NPDC007106]
MTDDDILQRIRGQDRLGELPPRAPPAAELEAAVGHPMPPLLRRIHLEVTDGGFGRWGEVLSPADTAFGFSDGEPLLEEHSGCLERADQEALDLEGSWRWPSTAADASLRK